MEVELEVVGRHAMLFDDDTTLEFVNSKEALIEWNSLFIDRFDVRNLITSPPPSFRNLPTSYYHGGSSGLLPDDDSHLYPDLDTERFADLNSSIDDDIRLVVEKEPKDAGGYNCVPFSYANSAGSTDQKDSDMDPNASCFHPSFPVPENLLQNLPPTEKVHQIIARTAMFVGEHGGQSEIVLRVKQGDNPTFGFLMPHHHLHSYFRYLVDHQEILKTDNDSKSREEKSNGIQASGALSLLGSVYGSGEDEDVAAEVDRRSEQTVSGGTSATDMQKSDQSEQSLSARDGAQKDETVSVHPQLSKVKVCAPSSIKPGRVNSMKSDGSISSSIGSGIEKPKALSLFPVTHVETSHVDPPSELKRLVDRIVEIILKNGKDFEKVLMEQDKKRGKFPFLLPSNQYNPYYLRVLKKAQESRISGKNFCPGKDGSSWQEIDENAAHQMKETELASLDGSDDLDLDYDKKEKFKMVIPKSKKDSQDQPSKESQEQCGFTVDATAAAAILQAATRGIRNPNLNIFSKTFHGCSIEGGMFSSSTCLQSSQSQSLTLKENGESSHTVRGDKEKLKAERLRRAKMFAAMIKSGNSGLATENVVEEVKGREGSHPPMEAGMSNDMVKSVQNLSNDENEEKLSKRRHYRSRKHDDGQEEDRKEGNGEVSEEDDEEEKRRSVKRHKSRHSSRHHRDRSKDRHKRRRRRASSKSKESRHRHKHDSPSSQEDDDDRWHLEKPDSSSEERKHRKSRHIRSSKSKESRHRHKHDSSSSQEDDDDRCHRKNTDSSSEEERKHRKRRHRHDRSSEEGSKHHKRRHKQSSRKDEHRERSRKNDNERSHGEEVELEEGEIRTRSSDKSLSAIIGDDASREASVNASKSPNEENRSSLPPTETTQVPDELRAKIRAMLLATM